MRDLTGDPNLCSWVFNARDVTERRRLETELRTRAVHDPLTGLANRTLFDDRLAQALAARSPGATVLLGLDLDGFKAINDTLGHAAGDRLLIVVADRLRGAVRPADTVARLGGDEFVILVDSLPDAAEVTALANRIVAAIGEPVDLDGEPALIGVSIGIATADTEVSASVLLRRVDAALYAAKRAGGRRWCSYLPERDAGVLDQQKLQDDLRGALGRGELVVHYQPVIDMAGQRMVGAEALLRWAQPGHGLVPPDAFIPIAERSGLIIPIGRWVLAEACRTLRGWQQTSPAHAELHMAVNLSTRQLHDPGLVDHVRAVLADTGLRPADLLLEITETVLVSDTEQVISRLTALKELGVRLAVDDFGTGYSSLSYLRRFPIDTVKIDRSFLDGVDTDPHAATLLSGVLALGRSLHLHTVAEGVETSGQADRLREMNCELAQGFHYARPVPAGDIEALLARQAPVGNAAGAAGRAGVLVVPLPEMPQ